ncbi:unnamed protein product [Phaedon cochleariae]|uniref:Plancitoxin-1 n=1 Tax=Phaedon cochleariae TaxID=80249 RepID=A0A9P0DT85_PHACE|nr:unnamed protein product [Phaedon cochleariae]
MCILLRAYIFICILFVSICALQCMDESNNPVDWFVVYKLPTLKHDEKLMKDGVAYLYMTSMDYSTWKLSNNSINSTDSIIGNTLRNLYTNETNLMYILYNNEPPNQKTCSNKGHTKGVVVGEHSGGYWLVHSVPHFPELGKKYTFPRSGAVYGQSFLCISLDLKNLNTVGVQLQYNEPKIYGENILSNLRSYLPDLANAASNVTIKNPPWYSIARLTSKNGVQFTSFAKTENFEKELYEDLVAPSLESDMVVETWPNGPGRLKSNCTKTFKVFNVKSIFMNIANVSFTTTDDHSKWGVSSVVSENNWICIGDINRAKHQLLRGGGTVCQKNKQIAKNYQKLVQFVEDCETNQV